MQRTPSFGAGSSGGATATSGSRPTASIPRMIVAPFIRLIRLLHLPLPTSIPASPAALFGSIAHLFIAACRRLNLSLKPSDTLAKLSRYEFTIYNSAIYVLLGLLAIFNLSLVPSLFLQILIPTAYTLGVLIPLSSQFVFPATPIFSWLLAFASSRFIPAEWRPSIHVVLLPTLESVLFGANISDILTRYTHPVLDVLAWIPYGVAHFTIPFVLAFFLWIAGPRGSVQYFAKAFGLMNLAGVLCQLVLPCAAPWYEIIHGLTPANYGMPGSPGGLMRIDRVFGSKGYTNAFGAAPLVFGAFPSLHAGTSTIEALFLTHFFPKYRYAYWTYVGILYWATMYLTHHYLIDVVGGGCLALACFFYFMPKEFKDLETGIDWEGHPTAKPAAEEYELAPGEDFDEEIDELSGTRRDEETGAGAGRVDDDVDIDDEIRKLEGKHEAKPGGPSKDRRSSNGNSSKSAMTNTAAQAVSNGQKPSRKVSWGATEVLGEKDQKQS